MRHAIALVLAGSLVSLAGARAAEATCMYVPLLPRVLTTRVTALPADGGVLVGYGTEVRRSC
jgi:hypothetical protein